MNYHYYKQIQPERAIQGNFSSGQINYKFQTDPNQTFIPEKSYIKFKVKLTKGNGDAIDSEFGLAPNMYCCDNLFQQIDLRINGKSVSRLSDYVAQCAALKHRLSISGGGRDALMSSCNYSKIDLCDRISQIASDGVQEKDIVWRRGEQLAANAGSGRSLDFLDLATPNRVQFIAASNRIVFSANGGADIPQMSKYFSPGDYIYFNDGAERALKVVSFFTTVSSDDTIVVTNVAGNVGAADLVLQCRIHDAYYQDKSYSKSEQASQIELIWTPPIGFFDIAKEVAGRYVLELTPSVDGVWQKHFVESLRPIALGAAVTDYQVEITEMNMFLYSHVRSGAVSLDESFVISDIRCSSQNLTTNSLSSTLFNIHPRNHSLTLAFQDSAVGDDIRLSRSKFRIVNGQELNLVRYYIQMDGVTLPDPIPSLEMDVGVNEFTQRYYENVQYSGGYENLERLETMEEWKRAGIFFHYRFGSGYKKSGQASIYTNFSSAFKGETEAILRNPQILLFDHYYTAIKMNVSNGSMHGVEVV